jgi:voltage-gated potassium channel
MSAAADLGRSSQLYVEPRLPARWEYSMMALTVLSLVIVGGDMLYEPAEPWHSVLLWADNICCLLFVIDFGARTQRAPRKFEFIRRNWFDLLGAIPMLDVLRGIRLVRLVRLLRITRMATLWRRISRRYDLPVPSSALGSIGAITMVMWMLSAFAFFRFESGENPKLQFSDALWWSMTTLSTVGYGDLYPATLGGRVVAMCTMVLGIGVLGAVAATVASAFVDFKDRGRRGLRRYVMRDHLLVLGWNDKAKLAIVNFLHDPRHEATDVIVVADLESTPMDDPRVRFVRGAPGKASSLKKASAKNAGAAIVLASDPSDARSDHENALVVTALRRLSPKARIAVELVDAENAEHLVYAGCDAVIDMSSTIAHLLVRSVQDIGVSDVVSELLSSEVGSELYRVNVDREFVGKAFRDYAVHMIEQSMSVIGVARDHRNLMNPEPTFVLKADDEVFVVSAEPPE